MVSILLSLLPSLSKNRAQVQKELQEQLETGATEKETDKGQVKTTIPRTPKLLQVDFGISSCFWMKRITLNKILKL